MHICVCVLVCYICYICIIFIHFVNKMTNVNVCLFYVASFLIDILFYINSLFLNLTTYDKWKQTNN